MASWRAPKAASVSGRWVIQHILCTVFKPGRDEPPSATLIARSRRWRETSCWTSNRCKTFSWLQKRQDYPYLSRSSEPELFSLKWGEGGLVRADLKVFFASCALAGPASGGILFRECFFKSTPSDGLETRDQTGGKLQSHQKTFPNACCDSFEVHTSAVTRRQNQEC